MKDLNIVLANDKTFQGLLADVKSAEVLGNDEFVLATKAVANYLMLFSVSHTGKTATMNIID